MSRPDGYLLKGRSTVDAIVAEVARGFGLSAADLVGPSSEAHIAFARACAMAVIRKGTDWSFPAIGRHFNRTHDLAVRNVQKVLSDPELRRAVDMVVEELEPPPRLFAVQGEASA